MESLKPGVISKLFFEPVREAQLTLLNRFSYYDYPHRTLSSLPTDRDIKRVVEGTAQRGRATIAPATKRECINWVSRNWGRYDSGMMGDRNVPRQNTLDGGMGRGKVSLVEKTSYILNRHVTETPNGLTWTQA
jgi:3-hydroxyisobutyryl-CoA hydrolase